MSHDMTPLLFDGFEVKIKMTDGNQLKIHPTDLPDKLRLELDKKCREFFEDHYDEMISKYKGGA